MAVARGGQVEQPKKPAGRKKSFPIVLSILIFIGLSVVTVFSWKIFVASSVGSAAHEHDEQSELFDLALKDALNMDLAALDALDVLYTNSEQVTADEFSGATEQLFSGLMDSGATFLWLAEPRENSLIISQSNQKKVADQSLLGFNVNSLSVSSDSIAKARDTGLVTSANDLDKYPGMSQLPGYVVFRPLYDGDAVSGTVDDRKNSFTGVLAIGLSADDFLKSAAELVRDETIDIEVFDTDVSGALLFDSDPKIDGLGSPADFETTIPIADRSLKVRKKHATDLQPRSFLAISLLVGGLILCAALVLPVYLLLTTKSRAQRLADRMTRSIAERENEYRALLEASPDPIVVIDRVGRITKINRAAEKASGYTKAELEGKFFPKSGVVPPKEIPKVLKNFAQVVRGRTHEPYDAQLKLKDGTLRTFEINSSPIKEGGKVKSVAVIMRDVTERFLKSQQAEQQKAELERVNKFMVGRELKMAELKREIEELRKRTGAS